MAAEQRGRAEIRLDEALEEAGVRDPRAGYRERLRMLRDRDQHAFDEARRYYEEVVVPGVAAPDSDPLLEWFEYGRRLIELENAEGPAGRLVVIDTTGRATDYEPPPPRDRLIIHLPANTQTPAFALSTPRELSPAQEATHKLLIERKLRLTDS